MKNFEITIKSEITKQDIDDLMVTALEGGINYWCGSAVVINVPKEHEGKYEFASDVISLGGELELTDIEEPEKWVLTRDKFLKGVTKAIKHFNFANANDLVENHDATVADVIIQFALFDEIVFG